MIVTTRRQREAIRNIWEEDIASKVSNCRYGKVQTLRPYRHIRRSVQPTFGMDGAVVVPIWNMFIVVEANGHRHS
jgi:hypothetical protein